jgi:hypothetical protein
MIWLLSLLASAGPLADGFRGQPWGTPFDAETPPANAGRCTSFVGRTGSSWTCTVLINEIPFKASYLYGNAGLMVGSLQPVTTGCATLRLAAEKAYGPGQPKYQHIVTEHWVWTDQTASASYEPRGRSCLLSASDSVIFDKHDAIERASIPDGAL